MGGLRAFLVCPLPRAFLPFGQRSLSAQSTHSSEAGADCRKRIEAEAEALIRDLGDRAYSEARLREREASSGEIARDWSRIALAVARKTGKCIGLDTATRMAMDAARRLSDGPGRVGGAQVHFF